MKSSTKRVEDKNSLDFYATPAWATRALFNCPTSKELCPEIDNILAIGEGIEPAYGNGDIARVIEEIREKRKDECFGKSRYFDIEIRPNFIDLPVEKNDFLIGSLFKKKYENLDWILTNPPFNKSLDFLKKSFSFNPKIIAFLLPSVWNIPSNRSTFLQKNGLIPDFIFNISKRANFAKGGFKNGATHDEIYNWFLEDWNNRRTCGMPANNEHSWFVWLPEKDKLKYSISSNISSETCNYSKKNSDFDDIFKTAFKAAEKQVKKQKRNLKSREEA